MYAIRLASGLKHRFDITCVFSKICMGTNIFLNVWNVWNCEIVSGINFSFKFLSVFQIVEIVDDSFRVHFKKWADPQWDEWLELCSPLTVARVANHKTQSSGML